jgi:hypothetical protein
MSIPRTSDIARYDRAEGLALGAGASLTPMPGLSVGLRGGWAFRAEHPVGSVTLATNAGQTALALTGYLNRLDDVGVGPVTNRSMNSLSSLIAGADFSEPFYSSGISLRATRSIGSGWSAGGEALAEHQRSATMGTDFSFAGDRFRPVREIDDTDLRLAARLEFTRRVPAEMSRGWSSRLRITTALEDPSLTCIPEPDACSEPGSVAGSVKPEAELGWGRRWVPRESELELRARAGAAFGDLLRQDLYLVGGHGTVPGYSFRSFGGDRYLVADATLSANLIGPWVRGRLLAAVGATGVGGPGRQLLSLWPATTSGGLKPSMGVGLGLVHDILRIDLSRGLARTGRWEVGVEANPSFWDFL